METRAYTETPTVRDRDGIATIGGYAAIFYRNDDPGSEYRLSGNMYERIMPGAFATSIRERDIYALSQHDKTQPLGRTTAGTLRLGEDDRGLWYEVDLPNTSAGRDMAENVRGRLVDGSSFGFGVAAGGEAIRSDGKRQIRELSDLVLFEVSPVTFPAYQSAHVGMRAIGDTIADIECIRDRQRRQRSRQILFDKYLGNR